MNDDSRDRILARRARFVALTLAAVACHDGEPAKNQDSVYLPPPEHDAEAPVAVLDAGTTTSEFDAARDTTGMSPATRERYVKLDARIAATRDEIMKVEEAVAKQPAFTNATSATWQELVAQVQSLYQSVGYLGIYCPKKSPETDAFLAHVEAEQTKLRGLVDALKKKATTKLTDKTMSGDARFDKLYDQWNSANPRPCLSIACDSW